METMVDIEAIGKAPDGAILSIGAVSFDPATREIDLDDTFYRRVSLGASMGAGMKADASTILWWMKQSDEARRELIDAGWTLDGVLLSFKYWRDAHKHKYIWAHGITYDIAILEYAIKLTNLAVPWNYRDVMDTRQLFRLAGIEYRGTQHHALGDAIDQAKAVIRAYDVLGNRKDCAPESS